MEEASKPTVSFQPEGTLCPFISLCPEEPWVAACYSRPTCGYLICIHLRSNMNSTRVSHSCTQKLSVKCPILPSYICTFHATGLTATVLVLRF